MKIQQVMTQDGGILHITADDGREGVFDITPYLEAEAFRPLKEKAEFEKVHNGGYFVEWECGADLSADTIEARWHAQQPVAAAGASRSR